jgi:hypothetical protein
MHSTKPLVALYQPRQMLGAGQWDERMERNEGIERCS